jgi:hypothetical protein
VRAHESKEELSFIHGADEFIREPVSVQVQR